MEREIKIEGVEDPCKELSAESSSGDEILKSIFEFLREKGVGYTVAKKSLTRKALSEGGIEGAMPDMPGELGIVYGTDPIEGARGVYEFQKKLDKKIQIVGGVFENRFMNQVEMLVISQIPGLKTLQAQFVNLINSPIQRLVIGLNAIAEKKQ